MDRGTLSALETAGELLNGRSLTELAGYDLKRLRSTASLGIKRAAVLIAAFELGRRLEVESASKLERISNSEDVEAIFRPLIGSLKHEEFWVLYLNSAGGILDRVKASQGGVSGSVVDHKLIVKRAVELLATAIIVVHNHPSGVTEPSDNDKEITAKLITACSLFDIELLDHVIVTAEESASFRDSKLIME